MLKPLAYCIFAQLDCRVYGSEPTPAAAAPKTEATPTL